METDSIPALCDKLNAELEDFIDASREAKDAHIFNASGRDLCARMQRMGSLIRMIREKGEPR